MTPGFQVTSLLRRYVGVSPAAVPVPIHACAQLLHGLFSPQPDSKLLGARTTSRAFAARVGWLSVQQALNTEHADAVWNPVFV